MNKRRGLPALPSSVVTVGLVISVIIVTPVRRLHPAAGSRGNKLVPLLLRKRSPLRPPLLNLSPRLPHRLLRWLGPLRRHRSTTGITGKGNLPRKMIQMMTGIAHVQ